MLYFLESLHTSPGYSSPVEAFLADLVHVLVPAIEICGALIIVIGTMRAIVGYFRGLFRPSDHYDEAIRLDLGRALILALEFQVGADILETALAPDWTSIGQLGAIIVLRTVLNHFLTLELEHIRHKKKQERQEAEGQA